MRLTLLCKVLQSLVDNVIDCHMGCIEILEAQATLSHLVDKRTRDITPLQQLANTELIWRAEPTFAVLSDLEVVPQVDVAAVVMECCAS